jgi:hypothetical protein
MERILGTVWLVFFVAPGLVVLGVWEYVFGRPQTDSRGKALMGEIAKRATIASIVLYLVAAILIAGFAFLMSRR